MPEQRTERIIKLVESSRLLRSILVLVTWPWQYLSDRRQGVEPPAQFRDGWEDRTTTCTDLHSGHPGGYGRQREFIHLSDFLPHPTGNRE